MVIFHFLQEYTSSLNSNHQYFLEKIFAYSVAWYLQDKSNKDLEKIAKEAFLIEDKERIQTRKYLLDSIKGKNYKIIREIELYGLNDKLNI